MFKNGGFRREEGVSSEQVYWVLKRAESADHIYWASRIYLRIIRELRMNRLKKSCQFKNFFNLQGKKYECMTNRVIGLFLFLQIQII